MSPLPVSLWARTSFGERSAFVLFSLSIVAITIYHFLFVTVTHPILGAIHPTRELSPLFGFLSGVVLLLTPVFLFESTDGRILRRAIELSGISVSIVALAHWFSDKGLLFWTFAPEYVFESTRARWPFVNPNHLAAFLLAPFFISLNQIVTWIASAIQVLSNHPRTQKAKISRIPLLGSLTLLFCFITLLAAQSRTSWFAATIGIGIIIVRRVLRSEFSSKQRLALIAASIATAGMMLVALSMSEQVEDIIGDRLEFAASSSSEDLRLKYFADSLDLIRKYPWIGVGPGGFTREIETVARPELAGLKPVYLHNDVLQVFVEYGAFVGMLLLVLIGAIFRNATFPKIVCFFGILIVSLLDFPFRLGALVAQIGFIFALDKTSRIKID